MPYTKTVWQTGDVLTAEGLNNVEDGVEGAVEDSEEALYRVSTMTMTINSNMELVVEI